MHVPMDYSAYELISIKVTLSEPLRRDVGFEEQTIQFTVRDSADSIAFAELIDRIGLSIKDYDGTLLTTVNGNVIQASLLNDIKLRDGDHIELFMMLTGG